VVAEGDVRTGAVRGDERAGGREWIAGGGGGTEVGVSERVVDERGVGVSIVRVGERDEVGTESEV
jgi:hypothetical protein